MILIHAFTLPQMQHSLILILHFSRIPGFERQGQDEPKSNGLESVEPDIHRVPSNTTLYESSKPLKQHPDGFQNDVLPHTPTENSMINTCMIITDSSTPDTLQERHESRPQTPTGAIITLLTSEINTEASDDKETREMNLNLNHTQQKE